MRTTEELRTLSLSADTSGSFGDLEFELATLKKEFALIRERRVQAFEVFDSAREFCFPVKHGFYTVEECDYYLYPAVHVAFLAYQKHVNDDRAFWLDSRIRDLEMVLGLGYNPQLPLRSAA